MSRCRHTCWLKPWSSGQETGLEVTDRPQRLLGDFENHESDNAGFVVLIGGQEKQAALRKTNLQHERICARTGGEVHLFASTIRESLKKKIVIADTDVPSHQHKPRRASGNPCHEVTTHRYTDPLHPVGPADSHDYLLHKMVFPFADVVVVFVNDIGGFEASLRRLDTWITRGSPSTSPVQPRLLFVVNKEKMGQHQTALEKFLEGQGSQGLNGSFHDVAIVGIPRLSKTRRWQVLGPELSKALECSRQSRRRSNYLLSIQRLAEFLQHSARSATEPTTGSFDFVQSSRLYHAVPTDLSRHIANFLEKFDSLGSIRRTAIPLIASSLLLDHYLPDMHLFDPYHVFGELYESACFRACSEFKPGYKGSLPPAEMFQAVGTSLEWHRRQLACNGTLLAGIGSSETCFSCIRRRPKYKFPCGHFVCQHCIETFYPREESDPELVRPEACHICSEPTPGLAIRIIPKTCRTHALSIDGGGIRGAAPIGFLKTIQDEIGIPNYDVQRHFDVKVGTSSGALSVISLDILGWGVDDCMAHLKKFAEASFPQQPSPLLRLLSRIPVLATVAELFSFVYAFLTGSKYAAGGLEQLLADTYGQRCIADVSHATEIGSHVGVTLTRASDGNYYHLKAGDSQEQPTWCEVYFPPEKIGSHGIFQDGGITHNNPACIAVREAVALSPDRTQPSIVVSLGTGSAVDGEGELSGMLSHSFPLRLWRALWRSTGSKIAWTRLCSHYKPSDSTKFFRFDLDFMEDVPLLDKVNEVDHIRQLACETAKDSPDLRILVLHLRAELFLFELDERRPQYFACGAYQCAGYIRCRLRAKTPQYEAFMQQLCEMKATIRFGGQVLEFSQNDIRKDVCFRVDFSVPSLSSSFAVRMVEERQGFDISGSPFTMKWLIRRQGLDMSFGTTDHRKRKALEVPKGDEAKRCKRWVN
ncbi:acyl transferase/acyl hydrolase/lysophospholipase [Dactylonectria macrodidyma]|uniref:Acyl transferase/acyl hydrolase/lysophospholipase n=1 Tax=Dactylonectria macrodidyma TaxID=307937 RepID=A0A9P9I945_9HYPO|nr:acyl transferase/acyl hydrolase/lysophospholipase [Dactylonectria macrodidyma]